MEFIKYTDLGRDKWNKLLETLDSASFLYTADNVDFICEYTENFVANESFLVCNEKSVIAAVILCIERINAVYHVSWSERYCPAPIISISIEYKYQEKIMKNIFSYMDKLLELYCINTVKLSIDPLINPQNSLKMYNYNFLIKFGYFDYSGLTQIIDLTKNESELYSDIRKGHKSSMKRGQCFNISFWDQTNITAEKIDIYRNVYEYDAGRVTRNSELSHHYLGFIKNGKGVLGIAEYNEEPVAVIIATKYMNTAYYSSYAEKTDCTGGNPPGHILQWMLMMYLKQHNIQSYEIGDQEYGPTYYNIPEEKTINISFFKRGFGGYTVSHYRGIRTYS